MLALGAPSSCFFLGCRWPRSLRTKRERMGLAPSTGDSSSVVEAGGCTGPVSGTWGWQASLLSLSVWPTLSATEQTRPALAPGFKVCVAWGEGWGWWQLSPHRRWPRVLESRALLCPPRFSFPAWPWPATCPWLPCPLPWTPPAGGPAVLVQPWPDATWNTAHPGRGAAPHGFCNSPEREGFEEARGQQGEEAWVAVVSSPSSCPVPHQPFALSPVASP